MIVWLAFMAGAFVCGSIPTGLIIARSRGVDIRAHGSGNIGATNVGRVLGRRLGLTCFAIDVLKGFAPTLAAGLVQGTAGGPQPSALVATYWLLVMALAILGHMYSPFAGFKGGKGVATGLGAMLGVYPFLTVPALAALAVWIVVVMVWRYVSVASVTAAVCLPFFVLVWAVTRAVYVSPVARDQLPAYRDAWVPFLLVTSLVAATVVVRHRSNLRRALAGTESKIGRAAGR